MSRYTTWRDAIGAVADIETTCCGHSLAVPVSPY